jgi:endonuclease YncB( thermonuclease family)
MNGLATALLLLTAARAAPTKGEVVLDGAPVAVRWTDGDSFRVLEGPRRGDRGRLSSVSALEAYGPVHRWGRWTGAELFAIAKGSAAVAAKGRWTCRMGKKDGYGRTLVDCPDAALALVEAGVAMVFAVEGKPDPALVLAQRRAQAAGAGMWKGGVPPRIPTSLHSADEPGLKEAYDRVADTATGIAAAVPHREVRAICEEVCVGEGEARACMVHVPFERRYRGKPACLKVSRPPR